MKKNNYNDGRRRSTKRHMYFLFIKNLKFIFRDRTLLLLSLITPVLLIALFSLTFQFNQGSEFYTIGVLNLDKEGVSNPSLNLSARASYDFIQVSSNLTRWTGKESPYYFSIYESYNGKPLDYEYGKFLCDESLLDAFIIIPENFSEIIIGSTWWYEDLVKNNFTNLNELIEEYDLDSEFNETALKRLNTTDFPLDQTPKFTIFVDPEIFSRVVITSVFYQIVNDIVLVYNNLNLADVEIINRNNVGNMFLTVYDSFMPYYIMITAMFPISSTAVFIIKERNARTLSLIDSTHVSRTINLLSIELSQLFMASVQNGIVIGFLFLSGTFIHPSANLAILYLNLLLLSFLSINIGAFLSILTKSTSAANLSAFLIMISFQLLGGTFFFVGQNISQWIPLYYANLISRSIIINGKNFLFILPNLWYLTLFSIVFFIIAIISFQKQKNEEVL